MATGETHFALQQEYYARTANHYDEMHQTGNGEHDFALAVLISYLEFSGLTSVLDIGSGTGRAVKRIKQSTSGVRVVGVEPNKELRAIGHDVHGLRKDELVDGNALALHYPNDAFDLVCEFGVLHHIRRPTIAVREMLRVARAAIFVSDTNNFGSGSFIGRSVKQAINAVGLWRVADFVKTTGKGYRISDGDGLYFSYSVFNDFSLIRRNCCAVHVMNTRGRSANHYRTADHVALLGIMDPSVSVGQN